MVQYGGAYYLYGSNNDKRAPVTRLVDIERAYSLSEKNSLTVEGMPQQPAWSSNQNQLWAPTVEQFGDRWIMWFSADLRNPSDPANPQCIGRAYASGPMGPFTPEPFPVHCGIDGHGALDPNVFTDADGRRWLLVAFGNTQAPIHTIPLDGAGNFAGPPTQILGRTYPWEYHFIENPSMIYDRARKSYLLSYSAGLWYEGALLHGDRPVHHADRSLHRRPGWPVDLVVQRAQRPRRPQLLPGRQGRAAGHLLHLRRRARDARSGVAPPRSCTSRSTRRWR